MPEKIQVTIIGLGFVGTSAGLALRLHQEKVTVVGHDRNRALANNAKRVGAVDRTEGNLIKAVSDADRILLALPVDEIRETFEAIAGDLKTGCLLVDTASVKGPVMAWAAELLPESAHMVGGHPILVADSPTAEGAAAEHFRDHIFCLTPQAGTDDAAVHLAADLVAALGAKPLFIEPLEHDGMTALVEQLPELLAGSLLQLAAAGAGWRDARKLAAGQFYSGTLIMSPDANAAAAALLANREHVLRWLDAMIDALAIWRQHLAAADETGLAASFEGGLLARGAWLHSLSTGNWEESLPPPEYPTMGGMMRNLVGFSRPPAQPKKKT